MTNIVRPERGGTPKRALENCEGRHTRIRSARGFAWDSASGVAAKIRLRN